MAWIKRMNIGTVTILMMVVGGIAGFIFGPQAAVVKPLGDLFIRLLLMAAVPLIFFNILSSFGHLTDLQSVKRISIKCFSWYIFSGFLALIIGLTVTHIMKPGVGMQVVAKASQDVGAVPSISEIFLGLVPNNVFQAFSTGNVAQIVIFGAFLGFVTILLPPEKRQPLQKGYLLIADLLRKLVIVILNYAPIGVAALAADTVGRYGQEVLGSLAAVLGAIWVAQITMMCIFIFFIFIFCRMSPIQFLRKTMQAYVTAIATCSSLATLVVSLEVAENVLRLPKRIAGFTLTLGCQFNKCGSAVVLAAVLAFCSQVAGVQFSLAHQIYMLIVGLILSEGTSGIPGSAVIISMIFVKAFNLPVEAAAMLVGVSRLVEIITTPSNVMGDITGTLLVTYSEGSKIDAAQNDETV